MEYEIHEYLKKSNQVFSIEDITTIISSHNTPETFIIALGLRLGELQALKYEDFDFENKLVAIKRRNECGRIKEFKHAKYIRQCRVPQIILNQIDKNKKGLIFKNIHFDNQEILRNTFFFLCIEKKVPFNIIARQLGFNNLRVFYKEHKKYIPKECDIDLLEDII